MLSKYEQNFINMLFSVRQNGQKYISKADGDTGLCEFHVTFGIDCNDIPLIKSMACNAISSDINRESIVNVIKGIEYSVETDSMDSFVCNFDNNKFNVSFQELNGSLHALVTVTEEPINMLVVPDVLYSAWYIVRQYTESHKGIKPGVLTFVANRVVLRNTDEDKVRNLIGNYLTLIAAGKYIIEMKDKEVTNDSFIKWIDEQVTIFEGKIEEKDGKKVVDPEYITFKQVQDRITALRNKYVGLNFLGIYESEPVFQIEDFVSALTDYDALPNDLE